MVQRERESFLGSCPECRALIPRTFLLIKYQAGDEWPKTYAECPNCAEVVHPV